MASPVGPVRYSGLCPRRPITPMNAFHIIIEVVQGLPWPALLAGTAIVVLVGCAGKEI